MTHRIREGPLGRGIREDKLRLGQDTFRWSEGLPSEGVGLKDPYVQGRKKLFGGISREDRQDILRSQEKGF